MFLINNHLIEYSMKITVCLLFVAAYVELCLHSMHYEE